MPIIDAIEYAELRAYYDGECYGHEYDLSDDEMMERFRALYSITSMALALNAADLATYHACQLGIVDGPGWSSRAAWLEGAALLRDVLT